MICSTVLLLVIIVVLTIRYAQTGQEVGKGLLAVLALAVINGNCLYFYHRLK